MFSQCSLLSYLSALGINTHYALLVQGIAQQLLTTVFVALNRYKSLE